MNTQLIQAGKIVNTHGTRGEVRILPWADSPEFLLQFSHLYIDGAPVKLISGRVHKKSLIAVLAGVEDINAAIGMKNKVVYIDRGDAKLPPGHFFLQDIIGLPVIDEGGSPLGELREVLSLPGNEVYVVKGDREILVPNVPAFILEKNLDEGFIRVRLIEGM